MKVLNKVFDYYDAFILVTGDITLNAGDDAGDLFIDEANNIYIAIPMNNLTEYSYNYSDRSGSLWQFKRDEPPVGNVDLGVVNGNLNSQSFKYKAALVGKTKDSAGGNNFVKNTKIVIPL